MIKLVYCIRRRRDVTLEAFRRYWREEHGPLVARHAEAIGAVRYIQSHTTAEAMNESFRAARGYLEPFDGITEVWWPSLQAMQAAYSTPAGIAAAEALAEDEARFIDFEHSTVFMTEEAEIFDRR